MSPDWRTVLAAIVALLTIYFALPQDARFAFHQSLHASQDPGTLSTRPSGLETPPACPEPFTWQHIRCLVRLGGLDFAIEVRGRELPAGDQASAAPIVLPSPGWGIECELKLDGLEPLFGEHTFLCMTTRGTHPSSRPANDSDMTSTEMAHDLELLRKWLHLHQLRLYAHSIGGTVALGYAELYPDSVSSLVLVEGKMLDYDDTPTLIRFVQERYTDPRYSQAIEALLIAGNFSDPRYPQDDTAYRELFLQLLPWYFADPATYQSPFEEAVRKVTPPQNWVTIVHDKQNMKNPTPNRAYLGRVKAPTLIVVGAQDAFCTRNVATIMHEGIKGSKLVVFDNCGHLPWIERKEDFMQTITQWWNIH